MDRNPFISRNNDLLVMFIAGSGLHLLFAYAMTATVQTQFLIALGFAIFAGIFLGHFSQCAEWAVVFMLGVVTVTLAPYLIHYIYYRELFLGHMLSNMMESFRYGSFLLSSWIIGIPVGFAFKKLRGNSYYRRGLF